MLHLRQTTRTRLSRHSIKCIIVDVFHHFYSFLEILSKAVVHLNTLVSRVLSLHTILLKLHTKSHDVTVNFKMGNWDGRKCDIKHTTATWYHSPLILVRCSAHCAHEIKRVGSVLGAICFHTMHVWYTLHSVCPSFQIYSNNKDPHSHGRKLIINVEYSIVYQGN